MEGYLLDGREIKAMLEERGVQYLYHANTVLTSLTFIKQGALLSRGFVEGNGLHQTEQESDHVDKAVGVWDSVFLDYLDHHKRWNHPNHYGPILFRMNLDLFENPTLPGILVTKGNPWYWKVGRSIDKSYFSSMATLKEEFAKVFGSEKDGRIMFTIPAPQKMVDLKDYLHSIVIDAPGINFGWNGTTTNIATHVREKIGGALSRYGFDQIEIIERSTMCPRGCGCEVAYTALAKDDPNDFVRLFRSSP